MLIKHDGASPRLDSTAGVAPNAVICGNATVGPGCRIMYGARVIAEGGAITIGRECITMENAVLRSSARHPLSLGNNCLVGPDAHVAGCPVEDEVFLATGAAIFHSARLGRGSEVRVHGAAHLKSFLAAGETVPIGWVAVGHPAQISPPSEHGHIWEMQKPLNFPLTAYGFERSEASMEKITRRLSEALGSHVSDHSSGLATLAAEFKRSAAMQITQTMKRLLLSGIAVFVTWTLLGTVAHRLLLRVPAVLEQTTTLFCAPLWQHHLGMSRRS